MRYLLLSSLAWFYACSPSVYNGLRPVEAAQPCVDKFTPRFTSVLYNTNVNVIGKHLSGLLLFKTMPDSSVRVIFSNEMGFKFFDFEYAGDNFRVVSAISQLNKKVVLQQLKKDIGYLLMYRSDLQAAKTFTLNDENYIGVPAEDRTTTWYITDLSCQKLLRIENSTKKKRKVVANLSGYRQGMPDSAYIAHQNFDFTISLKQIDR